MSSWTTLARDTTALKLSIVWARRGTLVKGPGQIHGEWEMNLHGVHDNDPLHFL